MLHGRNKRPMPAGRVRSPNMRVVNTSFAAWPFRASTLRVLTDMARGWRRMHAGGVIHSDLWNMGKNVALRQSASSPVRSSSSSSSSKRNKNSNKRGGGATAAVPVVRPMIIDVGGLACFMGGCYSSGSGCEAARHNDDAPSNATAVTATGFGKKKSTKKKKAPTAREVRFFMQAALIELYEFGNWVYTLCYNDDATYLDSTTRGKHQRDNYAVPSNIQISCHRSNAPWIDKLRARHAAVHNPYASQEADAVDGDLALPKKSRLKRTSHWGYVCAPDLKGLVDDVLASAWWGIVTRHMTDDGDAPGEAGLLAKMKKKVSRGSGGTFGRSRNAIDFRWARVIDKLEAIAATGIELMPEDAER